ATPRGPSSTPPEGFPVRELGADGCQLGAPPSCPLRALPRSETSAEVMGGDSRFDWRNQCSGLVLASALTTCGGGATPTGSGSTTGRPTTSTPTTAPPPGGGRWGPPGWASSGVGT